MSVGSHGLCDRPPIGSKKTTGEQEHRSCRNTGVPITRFASVLMNITNLQGIEKSMV